MRGIGAGLPGIIENLLEGFQVMFDVPFTDRRLASLSQRILLFNLSWTTHHMVESVQQVRRPVCVGRPIGDVIAHTAHRVEPSTSLVRKVTNDSLVRGVLPTPMTSPA